MTFRINRKNSSWWKLIFLGIVVPLFLLPFIHYHPETIHRYEELADAHQHQARYHSTTLEAYAHLVGGHFSNPELDDHFHHAHSSETESVDDTDFFILAKDSKSFKQGLVVTPGSSHGEFYHALVFVPLGSETVSFKSRLSRSPYSPRSPPSLFL
jgi:hypothetical protein